MRLTRMRTLGLAMLPAVAMVAPAAPVLANQTSRDVHVPEGNWFDVATRHVVKGPADLIGYPADLALGSDPDAYVHPARHARYWHIDAVVRTRRLTAARPVGARLPSR